MAHQSKLKGQGPIRQYANTTSFIEAGIHANGIINI